MNNAGCFEPGVAGTGDAQALFAQGHGLMYVGPSAQAGTIDAAGAGFSYTFRPFPATTARGSRRHSSN
jgi:ABC-type glycerol-3-phosphate transport system substrate-binding protein